jgi:DNA-binding transcriptional regulator LsrR (DeoR family)
MGRPRKIPLANEAMFVAAARLRSQGAQQDGIAAKRGVQQPDVSRLLAAAVDRGWLRPDPTFIITEESRAAWEEAQDRLRCFNPSKLQAKVQTWAPEKSRCQATIIPTDHPDLFARATADRVMDLVVDDHEVRHVGLLYGRTIDKVVQRIEETTAGQYPPSGQPDPVPSACGELIYLVNLQNLRHSSSSLSRR